MKCKISELTDRFVSLGLTGDEAVVKNHDWESRPDSTEDHPTTYCEEWDVFGTDGKFLGCLYDGGAGYEYAPGREAGHLDY